MSLKVTFSGAKTTDFCKQQAKQQVTYYFKIALFHCVDLCINLSKEKLLEKDHNNATEVNHINPGVPILCVSL